jgi:hypothetical protein
MPLLCTSSTIRDAANPDEIVPDCWKFGYFGGVKKAGFCPVSAQVSCDKGSFAPIIFARILESLAFSPDATPLDDYGRWR